MDLLIDVILRAGRSAVELSFFVLLPVMVVMLSLMRLLEARGVLDWVVARLAPVLRPLGLTGLGGFAALQINFVSFAAPVATLAMMDQRGASSRHIAATLAMVMAMAQANVSMPMAAMGLHFGIVLGWSIVGGLVAAAATYYIFGRTLSAIEHTVDETLHHPVAENAKGVLDVINRAGAEAFKIAVGSIPMLVLSLTVVLALRRLGALDALTALLAPLLLAVGADPALILPTLTKFLAGGTAMMGVMDEMLRAGTATPATLNGASAGLLIHPLDLPGVAVLLSAGRRVADVWKPAACGAVVGLIVRMAGHMLIG
ncbi:nucleoside recognition domain-containing protein [Zoogloea sp.]|uniref:nucleoside recognition domain-containing protein n=1 Tax=Zoogloea sp. TaxID=49181 RepID=UPI0026231E02|nr:nucleoside recognition domain-containing protein [Zoogloea sp.]